MANRRGRAGFILLVQTLGRLVNFHPHIHVLAADGVFAPDHRHNKSKHAFVAACRGLVGKAKSASRHAEELRLLGSDIDRDRIIDRHDHLANDVLKNLTDGLETAFQSVTPPEYPGPADSFSRI